MKELIPYSEIFTSMQGEGLNTGVPFVWLRFATCNLQCNGFGQADPTDPDTYELPYQEFDAKSIKCVEDLPVWNKGCDSSYSWAAKFKHLWHRKSAEDIAELLYEAIPQNMISNGDINIAFTGGEPMLYQEEMYQILLELRKLVPSYSWFEIVIETNGTKPIIGNWLNSWFGKADYNTNLTFSISPKLFRVSGEKPEKALVQEAVQSIIEESADVNFYLKFVVDDNPDTWKDALDFAEKVSVPDNMVWVMPVGATKEDQERDMVRTVADMALNRGWNFSGRLHTIIYGNQIGT